MPHIGIFPVMSHSRLRDIIVLSSDGEASDWWSEDAEDLSPQVSTRSSIRRTGLRSGRLSQGSTLLNEASKHQLEHKGQIDVENSTKGPAKEGEECFSNADMFKFTEFLPQLSVPLSLLSRSNGMTLLKNVLRGGFGWIMLRVSVKIVLALMLGKIGLY